MSPIVQQIRRAVGIDRPQTKRHGSRIRRLHGARLLHAFDNACGYCAEALTIETYTLDHFIAKQIGGNERLENMVVCCARCNGSKAHRDPVVWMRYKGYDIPRLERLRDRWCTIVQSMFGPWRPVL